jgi:hypothetical protein
MDLEPLLIPTLPADMSSGIASSTTRPLDAVIRGTRRSLAEHLIEKLARHPAARKVI